MILLVTWNVPSSDTDAIKSNKSLLVILHIIKIKPCEFRSNRYKPSFLDHLSF